MLRLNRIDAWPSLERVLMSAWKWEPLIHILCKLCTSKIHLVMCCADKSTASMEQEIITLICTHIHHSINTGFIQQQHCWSIVWYCTNLGIQYCYPILPQHSTDLHFQPWGNIVQQHCPDSADDVGAMLQQYCCAVWGNADPISLHEWHIQHAAFRSTLALASKTASHL